MSSECKNHRACGWTHWLDQSNVCGWKESQNLYLHDTRPLHEALKCEHYKFPTLEDVLPELTKAKVFSVCDLKSGYLHHELDHASSLLITFAAPFRCYWWLRLLFGKKFKNEIFKKRLHHALEGLEGVCCIADDVIFWFEQIKNTMHVSVLSSSAVLIKVLPWAMRSVNLVSGRFRSWATC